MIRVSTVIELNSIPSDIRSFLLALSEFVAGCIDPGMCANISASPWNNGYHVDVWHLSESQHAIFNVRVDDCALLCTYWQRSHDSERSFDLREANCLDDVRDWFRIWIKVYRDDLSRGE